MKRRVSLTKVLTIIAMGGIVTCLGTAWEWQAGAIVRDAFRSGVGYGLLWILANLTDAGMVLPSFKGLMR